MIYLINLIEVKSSQLKKFNIINFVPYQTSIYLLIHVFRYQQNKNKINYLFLQKHYKLLRSSSGSIYKGRLGQQKWMYLIQFFNQVY